MATTLVMKDPATGLRRGPIRWPDGNPPSPNGCRWCGHPWWGHGQSYVGSRWHAYTLPTPAQRRARMLARRRHSPTTTNGDES